jgi:hypothetical protein
MLFTPLNHVPIWCGLKPSASMALHSIDLLQPANLHRFLWSLKFTFMDQTKFTNKICMPQLSRTQMAKCPQCQLHPFPSSTTPPSTRCLRGVVWEKTSCGRGRFDAWRGKKAPRFLRRHCRMPFLCTCTVVYTIWESNMVIENPL